MSETLNVDICIIGGGSGGLSVAAGASQMGATCALVEKGLMGGDCLNYGCVPSKALLAAGHAAHAIDDAARFGITAQTSHIDDAKVYGHVHGVIAGIAPHDSVERFEGLGVKVFNPVAAEFVSGDTVKAGDTLIKAKRFVIATGSSAMVPPIPGLADGPFLTNETVFSQTTLPKHLIVIGGGPIGLEMAQAHRRLGSDVTVIEMAGILPKDDPEAADVVRRAVLAEGVTLREGAKVVKVGHPSGTEITVTIETAEGEEVVSGTHLLVAAGRKPNVAGMNLEAAGVTYSPRGIEVDARLRTTNKKIFAIGDVAGGFQFTHKAGYDAGIVIRNVLFRMPAKADYTAMPWVTFTDPEVAHVGLDEKQAREKHGEIKILRWPYAENDRARAEGATDGFVKAITDKKGRILGATIVGRHAGELIHVWILALSQKMKIGAMASMIAPYPTLGEISKRAAGSYYTPSLFSERTKKIVRFLLKLG